MTFDTRKILPGQEIVYKLTVFADACKYSTNAMLAARDIILDAGTSIPSSGTGTVLTIDTGDASSFNAASYLRLPSGEVVGVSVDSASQLTITSRAQYGTESSAQSGALECRILHQGEADGSCKGYPGGCSSPDSWDGTSFHQLIFSTSPLESGVKYHNGLEFNSVRRTGSGARPGVDIGSRGRVTLSISDENDELDLMNPYRDRISTKGTRFGKLLARHPYFAGRKAIFSEGLRDPGEFEQPDYLDRTYIINEVSLSDDQLYLSLLDPLIMTEGKKSKIPEQSTGTLVSAITGTPSTFTYENAADYHYGADSETVYVRIDSEIIKCTVTDTNELTVVTRGYRSDTKDHSLGAAIQRCEVLSGHVIDEITRIITDFTDTPSEYIDDYSATKALMPGIELDEAIIDRPADVKDILNELVRIGDLSFYFDDITAMIVIDYYPELSIEPVSLNDDDHLGSESIRISRNEQNQITRFTYRWAPYDITKTGDEYFEFSSTVINATLEGGRYIGAVNEKKTEKTKLLNSTNGDSVLAAAYVSRIIERNAEPPSVAEFLLDAENIGNTQGGEIAPGKILSISTREFQNENGDKVPYLYQIERIDGLLATGYTVHCRRYISVAPEEVDYIVVAGDYVNFDLSSVYAPAAGNYVVYIESGAIFGSYDTAIPAFTTGTQDPGVSFTIIHRGQMMGMGGRGGAAGTVTLDTGGSGEGIDSDPGQDGFDGGVAFEATVDCVIDCGSGVIWAGGAGQGGMTTSAHYKPGVLDLIYYDQRAPGNGGGGGRGFGLSNGGAFGIVDGYITEYGTLGVIGSMSDYGGGDWGSEAPPPTTNWIYDPTPSSSGLAGEAIKSNGNTVTISAGDNPINIRGRRT